MVERLRPTEKKKLPAKPKSAEKDKAREHRQTLFRYNQFISHFLTTKGNGRKAAILAGYAPDSAHVKASELLKIGYIAEKIDSAQKRMAERTEITVEKTMQEIAKLGFANMQDYVRINEYGEPNIDLSDLDPDQWAAIAEVNTETEMRKDQDGEFYPVKKVKIKLHDKLGSLEKLGKYLGAFNGKRGGNADDELPQESVTYTLNIGNANILIAKPEQAPEENGNLLKAHPIPQTARRNI